MAEAGVDTASSSARFFCHKCNVEITPRLPDYVCPRCNSGFIEELEGGGGGGGESDSDTSSDMELESYDMMWNVLANDVASGAGGGGPTNAGGSSSGPRRSQRLRHSLNPRHGRRRVSGGDRQSTLAPLLHDLIMQMTSGMMTTGVIEASVGGADLAGLPVGFDLPGFPVQLVASNLAGNPGDYAWGRGGLDAIITQLMNQLDGTGPPPMPKDKIEKIPTTTITQEQTDQGLQCSVCMEDFKLNESVRLLRCEHCYHNECIIPWLELHGTCPVCRLSLSAGEGGAPSGVTAHAAGGSSNSSNGSNAPGASVLAGFFGGPSGSSSSSGVSSVSQSGSSSSTSSSSSEAPRAGRRSSGGNQPPNAMFEDELD